LLAIYVVWSRAGGGAAPFFFAQKTFFVARKHIKEIEYWILGNLDSLFW